MKTRNESEALDAAIKVLKEKKAYELSALKTHAHTIYEGLRPINLIKNTLTEVTESPEIKDNLVKNLMGLASGYISKKVLFGSSNGIVKGALGSLLQLVVGRLVTKNSDKIIATGENLYHKFAHNNN